VLKLKIRGCGGASKTKRELSLIRCESQQQATDKQGFCIEAFPLSSSLFTSNSALLDCFCPARRRTICYGSPLFLFSRGTCKNTESMIPNYDGLILLLEAPPPRFRLVVAISNRRPHRRTPCFKQSALLRLASNAVEIQRSFNARCCSLHPSACSKDVLA